jgi:hypothetical protein
MNSPLSIPAVSRHQDLSTLDRQLPTVPPNSFVALLLRRALYRISAIKLINFLDGTAYERIHSKSRKSNAALLLPALFPVSPLLRYSYKKMGGTPPSASEIIPQIAKYLCCLSLTGNVQNASKFTQCFLSLTSTLSRKYQCCLPLTENLQIAPKFAQCFLSLTDSHSCKYLCCLPLTKKGGGGPRNLKPRHDDDVPDIPHQRDEFGMTARERRKADPCLPAGRASAALAASG